MCAGAFALPAQEKGEQAEKIVVDKNFLTGKLDNGLTYYIRKATNPAKSAEFYIVHNVGSLQEDDSQRGLAHFLEHMAFNGTKNFPDKTILNSLAKLGVKFGANINAYTSMDRTVYNISAVPMLRSSITDSVLLMLHDWSSYIACEPEEIEAERGVVLEEWRRGDDTRTRMMMAIYQWEQHGSRFAQRRVIGLPEVITSFSRETLLDYYDKWYRPDLQAVIVVGDVDPKDIEQRIKRIFSSIPSAKENAAVRETYPMPANGKPVVGRYTDPELKAASARFVARFPLADSAKRQTTEVIKEKLIIDLITDMLSTRCAAYAAKDKDAAGYKNIVVTNSDSYYAWRQLRLTALLNKKDFEGAMAGALREYERMRQHGFSQQELEDAKIIRRTKINKDKRALKNIKNSDYVDMAVEAYTRKDPLYDFPARLASTSKELEKITLDDIHAFVKEHLGYQNMVMIFAGSDKDASEFSSDERMHAIIDSLQNTQLDKYVHQSKNELAFTDKLNPVAIDNADVKQKTIQGLRNQIEISEFTLPNGIKIMHTNNPNLNGKEISVTALRKGGYSIEGENTITQTRILSSFLSNITPNSISKSDFIKYQSNSQMSFQKDISAEYDVITGSGNVESIEKFFKTLYLFINKSDITTASFNECKARLLKDVTTITSSRIFADSCRKLTFKDNGMLNRLTEEEVKSIDESTLKAAYNRHFGNMAGATFIFESNGISFDELKPYFEKYIANLVADKTISYPSVSDRNRYWKKGEKELRFYAEDVVGSKASVNVELYANCKYNTKTVVASKYLTYLLSEAYTTSIREERGGSYTISVVGEYFQEPQEYAKYTISFDTNAPMVDELVGCVWDAIKELAKNGPSEEKIQNTKLYYAKFAKSRREITKSVMGELTDYVKGLNSADSFDGEMIESITAKDVQQIAKNIYKQKNFSTFLYLPKK